MDAYAQVLERLRRDRFRALTAYVPDGRSRFSTWLVVVARRMCVDLYRQRFGRARVPQPSEKFEQERVARLRLAHFTVASSELGQVADDDARNPDVVLRRDQLMQALDDAVAQLSPEDQVLLKLRFKDDLSAQRISHLLDLPSPFHVYRRLKSVCGALRLRLLSRGIDDGTP